MQDIATATEADKRTAKKLAAQRAIDFLLHQTPPAPTPACLPNVALGATHLQHQASPSGVLSHPVDAMRRSNMLCFVLCSDSKS